MTLIASPPNPRAVKFTGAYYTPPVVAKFLVDWAIRSARDIVVDTSSGGGVFLEAAIQRIAKAGGSIASQVFGIELDPAAHRAAIGALSSSGLPPGNIRRGDFFSLADNLKDGVNAVVGNPPFIRYQQFNGPVRERASALLGRAGVHISELASSWAPFVVAGATLLRPGGRLAMVVPMELCHASYAVPVLAFLARSFRSVQFISFERRIFPELSQDTLLLLADDSGGGEARFLWKHLPDGASLASQFEPGRIFVKRSRQLETTAVASGRQRLIEQFMPKTARELYASLKKHARVLPLGAAADVGIGYVTGANQFFHLSDQDAVRHEIPPKFLRRAVFRGRALAGLRFTEADWKIEAGRGSAGYLLTIPRQGSLPPALRRYIEIGERSGVHTAYKCRVRTPWYAVPHVKEAEAFLTYMSGFAPAFVANDTDAVAPNTLHVVRTLPLRGLSAHELAVAWRTSLTALSVEIEGHAMGGGMLKLEPSEAERILVALPAADAPGALAHSLDRVARCMPSDGLQPTVDKLILEDQLGLTSAEVRCIRQAANLLRNRRYRRPQTFRSGHDGIESEG